MLRDAYKNKTVMDFDNINNISPEDLYYVTGLTHVQFETILIETPSLSDQCRMPKTALGDPIYGNSGLVNPFHV